SWRSERPRRPLRPRRWPVRPPGSIGKDAWFRLLVTGKLPPRRWGERWSRRWNRQGDPQLGGQAGRRPRRTPAEAAGEGQVTPDGLQAVQGDRTVAPGDGHPPQERLRVRRLA